MRSPVSFEIREPGTFTVDQVKEGGRYELVDGHPIYCAPSGGDHANATAATSLVLGTDPAVDEFGTDAGYTQGRKQLRAPDVSVGNVPNRPGWVSGAPRLAVEHAARGQDEDDLHAKVAELLAAGTEQVWVVRLTGPRRVEVWRQDGTTGMYVPGQSIEAPGILARPVRVDALFDPELAREVALDNMLARHGYQGLDQVREKGREEGREEGRLEGRVRGRIEGQEEGQVLSLRAALLDVLEARGIPLSTQQRARVEGSQTPDELKRWIRAAATARSAEDLALSDV